jgi:hypothetical protein
MLNLLMLLVGAGGVGTAVDLVESPTRLRRMHRIGTAGETLAIIGEQLLGRGGEVQSLPPGTVVTLTIEPPDGETPVISGASCSVDTAADTVSFTGDVPNDIGVCQFQFHMVLPDGRDLYFPDGTYGKLTVIPAVS